MTKAARFPFLAILATAAALLLGGTLQAQQNATVVEKVFNGITVPTTSAPVRNVGQAQHLLTLLFPNAVESLTGLSVTIEGSFDNVVYFPLHNPITSAALNTNGKVYAMAVAAGPWQYVRVKSTTTAPSAMTAYYTGHNGPSYPLGTYLVDPPTPSISANWALCVGVACTTGTNLTPLWIAPKPVGATKCFAAAKTGPLTTKFAADINNNGTSIFGTTKLEIAAGQTTGTQETFSAAAALAEGDQLTVDIDAAGGTPAQTVTITCRLQ